jgi:hypothetical protein
MKKLFSIVLIAVLSLGITKAQTVIFSEDFSAGINPAWGNSGTALSAPNPWAKWRYTHNGSHGAYGSPTDFINSPTKANGFIIFDSDSLDNGGVAGAFGLGPAPAPQTVSLTTTAIDVTGHPYCKLIFNQYFRNFQSTTVVGVSTDSINWTLDTINASLAVNGNTPSNSKISVDLSPVINATATPSNKVYISFRMDANYYFWMIDDINIITLPNNDLSAISTVGQSGTSGLGLFYSAIPASQADSFAAITTYGNIGQVSQPNTKVSLKELINGVQYGSTYTTNPPVALLPYSKDTSDGNIFYTNGIGKYIIAANVSSDSTDYFPNDNVDTLAFAVTDSVFSISTSNVVNGAYFITRDNGGLNTSDGTVFEVDAQDTVTSITTALQGGSTGTHAGAVVQATVYSVSLGTTDLTINNAVVTTIPKTLVAGDLSTTTVKPITLRVDNSSGNAILDPGLYYVAIRATPAPNDSNVVIVTTTYQSGGFPAGLDQTGGVGFFSSTDAPFANANFGHAATLLYANWTRNPTTSPVRIGQNITFTAQSNASASATYAWTMTGIGTSGLVYNPTGKVVTQAFAAADSFYVCVTVTDGGNTAEHCGYVKVRDWGVGINEVNALDATSLVPNPTTGKVTISADVTGPVSISMVNILGETVRTYSEEANGSFSKTYDVSALSSGIYLVKIANGGSTVTKRLSVSK